MAGIHGHINKAFNVGRRGISRHCHRTEGIDGGLNQHIGQRKDGALKSRRKSNPYNLNDLVFFQRKVLPFHPAASFHSHHTAEN